MAADNTLYEMTGFLYPKKGVHYIEDSRTNESKIKNLYIGSSSILTDLSEAGIQLDVATDFLLATGGDRHFWTEIIVKQVDIAGPKPLHIILDVGYELIGKHSATEIVEFASFVSEFCDCKGHKLALSTMTIVPDQQALKEKILEVNKGFNEINMQRKLTPHYGIRSVMKFHKSSGSYKIRPSLWQEWKDNVGYGSSLARDGMLIYIRYQKGYFQRGFEGTNREADLNTRIKDQNIQLQNIRAMDARIILSHKEKLRSRVVCLTETSSEKEKDQVAFVQLLLSNLPKEQQEDGGEMKTIRGTKRKRTEQREC